MEKDQDPTIIDQNSSFYNEHAKLACIFNDITAKQESIITQSAPEQVERVWVSASEGARREFGLLSYMPMPEAYEPRVGLAVQLAIFNQGCKPEGVFIDLTIHLKNAPSSEPDAGERHVPYAVFKPIKDGINNYVRGVSDIFGDSALYFGSSNSKSGDSGSSDITSKIQAAWDFLQIWIILLTVVFIILEAVEVITYPFTSIGAVGVSTLVDFCKPIILGLVAGAIFSGVFAIIEDTKDGKETKSSAVDEIFPSTYATLGVIGAILSFMLAKKKAIPGLAGSAVGCALAITGLVLTLIGTSVTSGENLLMLDILGICLAIGGLLFAVKSGSWGAGRLVPKIENVVTLACSVATFATVYSHIQTGKY